MNGTLNKVMLVGILEMIKCIILMEAIVLQISVATNEITKPERKKSLLQSGLNLVVA
jgi:hypothetical protein